MKSTDVLDLQISLKAEDATTEDLDRMTRQLLSELRETDVDSAELVAAGPAPDGAKAFDPVTMGAIAVAVLPTVLPKIVEVLQSWIARGTGRTVKFKGMIDKQEIEFEGPPEELKKLLETLGRKKK